MSARCSVPGCPLDAALLCTNPACTGRAGGAPVCYSHSERTRGWCPRCITAERETKARNEQALAHAQDVLRKAARAMAAAGHRPDHRYVHATKTHTGLFGKAKTVDDPDNDRYGWRVGEYQWNMERAGGDPRSSLPGREIHTVATFVTADGDVAAQDQVFSAQHVYAKSHLHASGGWTVGVTGVTTSPLSAIDVWRSIATRFVELARAKGVTVDGLDSAP